jgi:two-component sensor histidine kinase
VNAPENYTADRKRLAALMDYRVLDTAPEQPFEDVAALAAEICGTPVALVSLVEEHRQWFKAHYGTDLCETPINQSICSFTIQGDEVLEIEDTAQDPRTVANPLCLGDDPFRFYAGAPLVTPDGYTIGSLCVLDRVPRRLDDRQRRTLTVLAAQVMAQLELRKALRTAEVLRREIDHRVKNSLQSLTAVTRFEARRAEGEEARQALERVSRRIDSVAVVHEQLYQTSADEEVALDDYLVNLSGRLAAVAPVGVKVEGSCEPLMLNSRDAAMVGTLLNEAAANAFKHAFPDGRTGRLRYEARRLPDGRVRFSCEDNGVGVQNREAESDHGLGTVLGKVIALELQGMLDVEHLSPGLRLVLEFHPRAAEG